MTICRIDDADNLSKTYKSKIDGPVVKCGLLACVMFFIGMFAFGFAAMSGAPISLIWLVFILVAAIICLGYWLMFRNRNYFFAYVINEGDIYMLDIPKACDNSRLFGHTTIAIGGLAQKRRRLNNMKMLPTTSYVDEFICNRNVVECCGSVIDKVFDIKDSGKFVKVKAQFTAVNKAGSLFPTRVKTISIPRTFTNIIELRSRLEYLK